MWSTFTTALLSVIPLAYYIGMAVSSISAQSTFAVGAVLNATFGSMIELILYCGAIRRGTLDELVQSAVTGSLLATMLLLPGIAMVFGGLKYREQKVNKLAAGVSNVLLVIAIIGAFTPTIYYWAWGNYSMSCRKCAPHTETNALVCTDCTYTQVNYKLLFC